MAKYRRLRERVAAELPDVELQVPDAISDLALLRVHTRGYIEAVIAGRVEPKAWRRVGFPWSPELVERSRRSVGGTLAACRAALIDGVAVNLAGGTHHAYADRGEGFCVWNDAAVAARQLQHEGIIDRVLVVDCDVHQGNGTAAIFQHDPSVFTLSLHGRKNFPFHKEASDLDVAFDTDTGDDAYLEALDDALDTALAAVPRPDLVIYLAGADPYVGDRLGKLALSRHGLAERDRRVLERARRAGSPIAVAMAGGYAPDIEAIVDIHLRSVALAAEFARLNP